MWYNGRMEVVPVPQLDHVIGHVVMLSFYDHCRDSNETIRCEVYGRLVRTTPDTLIVASWVAHDAPNNDDLYALVRSAVFAATDFGPCGGP